MTFKIQGKVWTCGNQCKSNCCSEVFLAITPEQRVMLENHGHFIADSNMTDWRWLGFHKRFSIEKLEGGKRKISIHKPYSFKFNPYLSKEMLNIENKCEQLMPDNRCRVYRNRPQICKVSECPVFELKQA